MKPNSTICITGSASARRNVPASRKMCRNSFRKTARNDRHMSGRRLAARAAGVLGQLHEHVLQRRMDLADRRGRKATLAHVGEDLSVVLVARNDSVDRLAEDRRAEAPGLLPDP